MANFIEELKVMEKSIRLSLWTVQAGGQCFLIQYLSICNKYIVVCICCGDNTK